MTPGSFTRRRTFGLLAAGLAAPGLARAAPPLLAPAPGLPEAEFTPEDGAADLIAMEDRLRRMTAPVMINGRGPFDFMVDTGTNRSVISDALAASLELPQGSPVIVHGISGSRDVPTFALERFAVGGREAKKITMPCLPASTLGSAGILGVDGLKQQRVVLELQAARLRIEPSSKAPHDAGGTTIQARRRFGQLTVVDTDLEGIKVAVMIDTGAEATVGNTALRRAVNGRRHGEPSPSTPVRILGATGESFIGEYGAVPLFRMGGLKITNLRVVYADLHPFKLWELETQPALLMGMDVIRFFDILSLDYGRNQVRFDLPAQPFIDPAGTSKRS